MSALLRAFVGAAYEVALEHHEDDRHRDRGEHARTRSNCPEGTGTNSKNCFMMKTPAASLPPGLDLDVL
ncbi:UNVERIFIED_ORG: hypothetical protein FHR35_006335 [Microbispora rosea subsp. rosea]